MNGHAPPPETLAPNPDSHLSPEEQTARAANLNRFELELEFVQALANPHYLESLAVQGLLNQPAFINYLKYLTYWLDKDRGYGKFVS
jgi:mediator of RNA polymerase II transcription subunit 31